MTDIIIADEEGQSWSICILQGIKFSLHIIHFAKATKRRNWSKLYRIEPYSFEISLLNFEISDISMGRLSNYTDIESKCAQITVIDLTIIEFDSGKEFKNWF